MANEKKETTKKEEEYQKKIIRQNLIYYRKKLKLSQDLVAEELGVTRATYANYEKRSNPPHYVIAKLSRMYRIPLETFYIDNELEEAKRPLYVSASGNGIYGERHFTELSDYEKLLVMKVRQLNKEDRDKLNKMIKELLPKDKPEE